LLEVTLPALLAPGNLDAIASHFDCELRIVTEGRFFDVLRASAVFGRLSQKCPVEMVSLDDLIGGRSYGMSLTHAFHRGFEDLGPRMVGYHLFFLNADFILAEGSYRAVVERLDAGARLVFAPSYCVVSEDVVPILRARMTRASGALGIAKREMASIALAHLHDTVDAKTVNRRGIRAKVFDQYYWRVDRDTLLGYQMPVALVAMVPERAYLDPVCFWDYGVAAEACPDAPRSVIGDSDEFLMIELRARAYYRSELGAQSSIPSDIAATLAAFMTRDQVVLGAFPLVLHAAAMPDSARDARRELDRFRQSIDDCLPATPVDHRNHPYWTRQLGRFARDRAELAKGRAAANRANRVWLARFYDIVFGRMPFVSVVHPLWPTLHVFVRSLVRMGALKASRGLWVRSGSGSMHPFLGRDGWRELSALTAFKYGLPADGIGAALCVCELSWDDFARLPALLSSLRVGAGGATHAVVFVADREFQSVGTQEVDDVCRRVGQVGRVRVSYAGSPMAAMAGAAFRTAVAALHDAGLFRLPGLSLALLAMMPLALLASALELVWPTRGGRTSACVIIESS
ncbi:MAG: hypothetical protein ACKVSF_10980, partial [Alphaproteobacteria bacterium]